VRFKLSSEKIGTVIAAIVFVFVLGSMMLGIDYMYLQYMMDNTIIHIFGGLNAIVVVIYYGIAGLILASVARQKP
jgi:TM2 domain-containing membrane protein YozV